LRRGAERYRVAIMCSEEDPTHCHRRLLVAKVLLEEGLTIGHIRGDGRCERESEPILLSEGSLFDDEESFVEIFTIGFTQTTAEDFFGRLKSHGVERLLDVRLNNRSQLAGFAKRDDLAYFLRELLGARYEHAPLLAPSEEILTAYKKQKDMTWSE
jgi:uncharacterized protein (DUF488 family)